MQTSLVLFQVYRPSFSPPLLVRYSLVHDYFSRIFFVTDLTENSWGLSPIQEEEDEEEPYWCQTDEYLCQEYHHQRHLQLVDFNPKLHSNDPSNYDAAVEVTAAEAGRRSYKTLEAEGSTEDVYYPCEDTPPQYNNKVEMVM
jgi:hypothetical protein